jgi:glycosyltransferase involved in cell wall biosynthesis
MTAQRKVLFFIEGFTDIRFVVGLSQIAELTLCVPSVTFSSSGLRERLTASGARVRITEIPGSRAQFQARSLAWLWRHARDFDAIVSQEVLRGSVNATLVGRLRGVPVITYMAIAPVEYFRCRYQRGQMGWAGAILGEAAIRGMMTFNGRLATRSVALGPYLREIAARYSARTDTGLYYGVDTSLFTPADADERRRLRVKQNLPADAFLIFFASRVSHEKDPETVLRAAAIARAGGLNAVVLNLGGGYREFVALADPLGLKDASSWVLGRPAAHPMIDVADYFRTADVIAQASHAEGLGLSPLEALACDTPVVATAVGGMAVQLKGVAQLVPRQDAAAMAAAFEWVAAHPEEARAQAARGRDMVVRDWSRERAFSELARVIAEVAPRPARREAA